MVFSLFKKPEIVVAKPAARPAPATRQTTDDKQAPASANTAQGSALPVVEASGLSDFVFSESSPQFQIEAEIDPVDAEAQESAILYANAQDTAARVVLEHAARQYPFGPGERLWLMLFDLYQLQADHSAFDALSVDYAKAFEKSPPAWRVRAKPETTGSTVSGSTLFKGDLCEDNQNGFSEIERALASGGRLKIDLSRVKAVDESGCERLLILLQQARKARRPAELLGREALLGLLRPHVSVGVAEYKACWLMQLEIFQQQGLQEDFENLAIDYAVTFEVSPPSWEADRVALPESSAVPAKEGGRGGSESYLLEGEIKGGRFPDLPAYAEVHEHVLIDCATLKRIDFVSAGALLNVLTAVRSKGRQIVFRHPNRLVAELFSVVGLNAVATIALAKN